MTWTGITLPFTFPLDRFRWVGSHSTAMILHRIENISDKHIRHQAVWFRGKAFGSAEYVTFMGPRIVNVFISVTNKMQRCIILFIIINYMFRAGFFPLIIRSSYLYMQHQVFVSLVCCYRSRGWVGSPNSSTPAVTANWQIPDAACTDLSSWWWAEKPLETCRALTVIESITQRCVLLVMLKNTLSSLSTLVSYWWIQERGV
jgi:hypothetical protein